MRRCVALWFSMRAPFRPSSLFTNKVVFTSSFKRQLPITSYPNNEYCLTDLKESFGILRQQDYFCDTSQTTLRQVLLNFGLGLFVLPRPNRNRKTETVFGGIITLIKKLTCSIVEFFMVIFYCHIFIFSFRFCFHFLRNLTYFGLLFDKNTTF